MLPFHFMICAEDAQRSLPRDIADRISAILNASAPNGKFESEEFVTVEFQTGHREYRSYKVNKSLRLPLISIGRSGPTPDGFDVAVSRGEPPGLGSAVGGGWAGRIQSDDYWYEYRNFYRLPDDSGHLALEWRGGVHSDRTILSSLHTALAESGEPVFGAPLNRWNEHAERIHETLHLVIQRHLPQVQLQITPVQLEWTHRVRKYDVHAVTADRSIEADAHQEMGPEFDGIMIRVRQSEPVLQRETTQITGRSRGPFWMKYVAQYNLDNDPIYLEILYGSKCDQKLLEAVTNALDKLYGPPPRF